MPLVKRPKYMGGSDAAAPSAPAMATQPAAAAPSSQSQQAAPVAGAEGTGIFSRAAAFAKSGNEAMRTAWFDVVKGQMKGVGNSLVGAAELATKVGGAVEAVPRAAYDATIGRLTGRKSLGTGNVVEKASEAADAMRGSDILTPQNKAQKFGFTTEKVAEMLLPVGQEAVAAKVSGKLAPIAGKSKLAAKAIDIAARSLGDAGEAALKTAVSTGGDKEATAEAALTAGVASAGFRTAGEALQGIKGIGKNLMSKIGQSARNLDDAEVGTIRKVPETVEGFYGKLSSAGDDVVAQQKARQEIEDGIFDTARDAWNKYADDAGKAYEKQMAAHGASVAADTPLPSRFDIFEDLKSIGEKNGIGIDRVQGKLVTEGADDAQRALIERIGRKIAKSGEKADSVVGDMGWNELDGLRKDIGSLYDTVPANSPQSRLLDEVYNAVKTRMMSLADDPVAVQGTLDQYRQFLSNRSAFKNLASNASDPNAVARAYLELSRAATGQKGRGTLAAALGEALQKAGRDPDEIAYQIKALDLASKLAGVRRVGTTEAMIAGGVDAAAKGKTPDSLIGIAISSGKKLSSRVADEAFLADIFNKVGVEMTPDRVRAIQEVAKSQPLAKVLAAIVATTDGAE